MDLTANGSTGTVNISAGDNITLDWSSSPSGAVCSTSGSPMPGFTGNNGTASRTTTAAYAGNTLSYTFTCTYGGNTDSKTVTVKVGAYLVINGSDYNACSANYEVQPPNSDGRDGCFRSGTSEYSWRGVNFYYRLPAEFRSGRPVQIQIIYRNWASNPPGGYYYRLRAGMANSLTSSSEFWLTSGPPYQQRTYNGTLYPTNDLPRYLAFTWWNDSWTGGDANLQIEQITLTQNAP